MASIAGASRYEVGDDLLHAAMMGRGVEWIVPMVGMAMFLVLPVVAVVVAIVLMSRMLRDSGEATARSGAGRSKALDILDERFARGELDREEFDERRRALGG